MSLASSKRLLGHWRIASRYGAFVSTSSFHNCFACPMYLLITLLVPLWRVMSFDDYEFQ